MRPLRCGLPVLALVAGTGCTPEPGPSVDTGGGHDPWPWLQDLWPEVVAVCEKPDSEYGSWGLYSPLRGEFMVSQDCVAVLATHLGMAPDALADPFVDGFEQLDSAATGALQLALADLGTVDQLDDGPQPQHDMAVPTELRDLVRDLADAQGYDQVAPLLYNWVASSILSTDYGGEHPDNWSASSNMDTRHLTVYAKFERDWAVAVMAHEVTHIWTRVGHVDCPENTGGGACDETWLGAYGFETGVTWMVVESRWCDPADPDHAGEDQCNAWVDISEGGGCHIIEYLESGAVPEGEMCTGMELD